jgi:hypothetical protein
MIRAIVIAAALSTLATSTMAKGGGASSAKSDLLNPEDCKLMAALGRKLLHWDTQKPDVSMFAIFYRPEGSGYIEQCPWKALGVAPLPPGQPDMSNMQFFTKPKYGPDRKTATMNFVTRLVSTASDGKPMSPFLSIQECTLFKAGATWQLKACQQGPIT